MRLFIFRHGESQSNADWETVKKPADLNSPLTELGLTQAKLLAEWMQAHIADIDLLFSSPLQRAKQTAAPIADAFGLSIRFDPRLREGGYNYANRTPIPDDRLPMTKSTNFHQHPHEPFDPTVPGCESYADLKERVAEFLDEIVEEHPQATVAVSTHGWTNNAFFDVIFNSCSFRQCYFLVENTALSMFEYDPEIKLGPWRAYFLAQTPHLPFSIQDYAGEPV